MDVLKLPHLSLSQLATKNGFKLIKQMVARKQKKQTSPILSLVITCRLKAEAESVSMMLTVGHWHPHGNCLHN